MKQVTVSVNIPEEVIHLLGLKEKELERELKIRFAVTLYSEGRVSLGKAVEISGLPYAEFMELLADYGLGIDYGLEDLQEDLQAIKELDALGENHSK